MVARLSRVKKHPSSNQVWKASPQSPHARKLIKLAGDFDGLGTHAICLEKILKAIDAKQRPEFKIVFGSENDAQTLAVLQGNHVIQHIYPDASLAARDIRNLPKSTIYVAGPPCQPFASGGKQHGAADARGCLILV